MICVLRVNQPLKPEFLTTTVSCGIYLIFIDTSLCGILLLIQQTYNEE